MNRAIWGIFGVVSLCACTRNVVIRVSPSADPGTFGPTKVCELHQKPCTDDTTFDSSRFTNTGGASFFVMPTCMYGVHALLVEHAESVTPRVYAQCNAPPQLCPSPDGGIPTTTPGGGTTATPDCRPH